jgi:hypothetical protein
VPFVEGAPDGASTVCHLEGKATACGRCVASAYAGLRPPTSTPAGARGS